MGFTAFNSFIVNLHNVLFKNKYKIEADDFWLFSVYKANATFVNEKMLDDLFYAYITGNCSETELEQFFEAIKDPGNKERIFDYINLQLSHSDNQLFVENEEELNRMQALLDENLQRIFQRIDAGNPAVQSPINRFSLNRIKPFSKVIRIVTAAAVAGIFIGIFRKQPEVPTQNILASQSQNVLNFKPGKNAAVLTIDGGKKIALENNASGVITQQGNSSVSVADGELKYSQSISDNKTIYNTLRTSNGNQFTLILPDGTKVWLNAASSIRYPVAFNGNERQVEVSGELYFEVQHDEKHPFRVLANDHIIEDIGTSFNVHAYKEESSFSTTLLKGAIKIAGTVLKPGTQALIENGKIDIRKVDTTRVIAWKNGLFSFHQTPVKEVMRQIARWYDVEVEYEGKFPEINFGGKISRNSNASTVFTILQKSGLLFKAKGRKIIVSSEQ